MAVSKILVVLGIAALFSLPSWADESRDRVKRLKAVALESNDPAIIQSVDVLDKEGLLRCVPRGQVSREALKASQTLREKDFSRALLGFDDEKPAESTSTNAESTEMAASVDWKKAREVAIAHFKNSDEWKRQGYSDVHCPEDSSWVKRASDGYQVTMMPVNLGIVCFFVQYVVTVDASTGKVLGMK